jgi:hypothetical protein
VRDRVSERPHAGQDTRATRSAIAK